MFWVTHCGGNNPPYIRFWLTMSRRFNQSALHFIFEEGELITARRLIFIEWAPSSIFISMSRHLTRWRVDPSSERLDVLLFRKTQRMRCKIRLHHEKRISIVYYVAFDYFPCPLRLPVELWKCLSPTDTLNYTDVEAIRFCEVLSDRRRQSWAKQDEAS